MSTLLQQLLLLLLFLFAEWQTMIGWSMNSVVAVFIYKVTHVSEIDLVCLRRREEKHTLKPIHIVQ